MIPIYLRVKVKPHYSSIYHVYTIQGRESEYGMYIERKVSGCNLHNLFFDKDDLKWTLRISIHKRNRKKERQHYTLDNQKQVILQYKINLTKLTIDIEWWSFQHCQVQQLSLCVLLKEKRIIWTTIFVISLLTGYYGQFTIHVEGVLHFKWPGFWQISSKPGVIDTQNYPIEARVLRHKIGACLYGSHFAWNFHVFLNKEETFKIFHFARCKQIHGI